MWQPTRGGSGRARAEARRLSPRVEGLEGRALLAAPYPGDALDLGGTNDRSGTNQTPGVGVAADTSGDAVTTGSSYGTTNFDPKNPADTAATLTSQGLDDAFLWKLKPKPTP